VEEQRQSRKQKTPFGAWLSTARGATPEVWTGTDSQLCLLQEMHLHCRTNKALELPSLISSCWHKKPFTSLVKPDFPDGTQGFKRVLGSAGAFPQSPTQRLEKQFASSSAGVELWWGSPPRSQEPRDASSSTHRERWVRHPWGHGNSHTTSQFGWSQQNPVDPNHSGWPCSKNLLHQNFTSAHVTQLIINFQRGNVYSNTGHGGSSIYLTKV